MVNAAWAATHKKDGHLRAPFLRIKSRGGAKKAILAVASSMLTAVMTSARITSSNATQNNSPGVSFSVSATSASPWR